MHANLGYIGIILHNVGIHFWKNVYYLRLIDAVHSMREYILFESFFKDDIERSKLHTTHVEKTKSL